MAEIISINKRLVDRDNLQGVVDMLNGIALACYWDGEFQEGWRNKVIVDLVAGSTMVGLNAYDVMEVFVCNDLINPNEDDEDTWTRVERVMDYKHRFCWNWLISPEEYVDKAKDPDVPGGSVEFVLV